MVQVSATVSTLRLARDSGDPFRDPTPSLHEAARALQSPGPCIGPLSEAKLPWRMVGIDFPAASFL